MSRSARFALSLIAFAWSMDAAAQVTETGPLAVYSDVSEGALTASGATYSRSSLTAAHASLPLGTRVRVANFDTGRMVDVVINDRKAKDRNLLVLSRAAADQIGVSGAGTANGAVYLNAPASAPSTKKAGPLAGIFGKGQSSATPVKYGIPADRYAPPVAKKGGLFGLKSAVPSSRYPTTPVAARPELQPLNAMGPVAAGMPARSLVPAPSAPAPSVALPPASPAAPYRVQFGAFKRVSSAEELSGMLDSAGIPSTVFMDSERGLNVVVTDGGFATTGEAQRWIDFEGARRGWTERPVVIR